MSRDYKTELEEDVYEENHRLHLLEETAKHVAKGMGREDAIKHVIRSY